MNTNPPLLESLILTNVQPTGPDNVVKLYKGSHCTSGTSFIPN